MTQESPQHDYQLLATCAFGLESLVRRELEAIGCSAKVVEPGRVAFFGNPETIINANLWLRTADRVLIKVADFPAPDFDALFESTRAVDWNQHIPQRGQFPVTGRCLRSTLTSVPACQRAIKRAIAESLIRGHSQTELPEDGPRYAVDFTILKDRVTLTIDTSGSGLHRRGYHRSGSSPQVKETLAAAMVMLSYWRNGRPMIDPFCGGGTLAIEAAMIGLNIAPGINRTFACEEWGELFRSASDDLRPDALTAAEHPIENRILACDTNARILHKARSNAKFAGVDNAIHFDCKNLQEIRSQKRFGCLIALPPAEQEYRSLRERDEDYRQLPELFRRLPTWSHYVLTDMRRLESLLGRPADRRRKLYSGGTAMTYFQFHGPKPVTNPATRTDPSQLEKDTGPGLSSRDSETSIETREGGLTIESGGSSGRIWGTQSETSNNQKKESKVQMDSVIDSKTPALKTTKALPETDTKRSNANDQQPIQKRYEHASGPAAFGELSTKSREQADLFASRIRKRAKHLRRWPTKRGISCYRLYERDIPEIPLIVDIYEDCLHITEYDRPHERDIAEHANWLDLMADTAAISMDIPRQNVSLKRRGRQKGKTQHDKIAETHLTKQVSEGGLKFLVNLYDYVDTGLFLDHRVTRGMIREQAKEKSFLNLFCYTGSFTVYAADGGASQTVSVDLSRTYLEWAQSNLALNNLHGEQHQFIAKDVMQFVQEHPRKPTYDLVVIDPPTFSNSKRTQDDWTVQGNTEKLLHQVLPLVNQGGVIYFSTNFRRFKFQFESLPVSEAHEISRQTVPEDFRNRRIHRCWRLVR